MPTLTKNAVSNAVNTGTPYTNPENVYAEDGNLATATSAAKNQNPYNDHSWGFPGITTEEIPDGSTIDAVRCVGRLGLTVAITGGVMGLNGTANGSVDPGTEQTKTTAGLGILTYTFVTIPNLADLRTAEFYESSVRYRRGNTTVSSTAQIDYLTLEIDYTPSTEQHSGTFSVSGGGSATLTAQKAAVSSLAVSGGGATALGATTDRLSALEVTGGGSVTITASGEVQPEEHSGIFSVSGGGGVTFAASSNRSTVFGTSGGGVVTFTVTFDRGSALAVTGGGSATVVADTQREAVFSISGGGSVIVSATAEEEGPNATGSFAVAGGGAVELAADTARATTLGITAGGSVELAVMVDRPNSLDISGGGSVSLAHTASWGDVKSATLAISGGGSTLLTVTGDHAGTLVVSGGGALTIAGSAAQAAPDVETTLSVTGGGGVTITTVLPGVDVRGIHAAFDVVDPIKAQILTGLVHATITSPPAIVGDIELDNGV